MNVGILWDIENVTPPVGTNYVQAVLDAVSKGGRVSYAMAFGDWNGVNIKSISYELSANNFELIHTPHNNKKNSADISLVAYGVELIFKYPHIDKFVLISGDGDFRPLLLSLKKYGKETLIICDISNNASEELVKMADNAIDYRDIIKQMDDLNGDMDETSEENILTKEQSFELFKETVGLLIQEGINTLSTSVKTRMKLLNKQFNENHLGYATWRDFVEDAKKITNITFNQNTHCFVFNNVNENTIPKIFDDLLNALSQYTDWVLFQIIAPKINYKDAGYKKFKELAIDASKRGYIEIKNNTLDWSMKKKMV
jgi:uncharacterized protein YkuJ